jgi:hypothetical protein
MFLSAEDMSKCGVYVKDGGESLALLLGVFKPGALHPVPPAPIKALPCLCLFPPMAEKSKPRLRGWSVTQSVLE